MTMVMIYFILCFFLLATRNDAECSGDGRYINGNILFPFIGHIFASVRAAFGIMFLTVLACALLCALFTMLYLQRTI